MRPREEVEAAGRVAHVLEQFFLGDARQAGLAVFVEAIEQRAVGQFHRHDQETAKLPRSENRQQVRVAQALERLQRTAFDVAVRSFEANELESDVVPAWPGGTPDLAEAAAAEARLQFVVRQRTGSRSQHERGILEIPGWRVR